MDFFITLTIFDSKIGPFVFYSYPISNIEEDLTEKIEKIHDLFITEGFMMTSFGKYHSLNYYFTIGSTWARGDKETLLLSAIFEERVPIEIEKAILTLCIEFSEWIKRKEDIFKGFYNNHSIYNKNQEHQKIIDEKSLALRILVEEFYEAISEVVQEKIVEENITTFIEKKDALATLKLLSLGSITLGKLRDWYSTKFPDNNFYKLLIKLIRYHLITIPNVGKSKTPPFDVYIEKRSKELEEFFEESFL